MHPFPTARGGRPDAAALVSKSALHVQRIEESAELAPHVTHSARFDEACPGVERDARGLGSADDSDHLFESGVTRFGDQPHEQGTSDTSPLPVWRDINAILASRSIRGAVAKLADLSVADHDAVLFRDQKRPSARQD